MSLYECLGVAKDATKSQIKKAYRRAAQKVHPDREDGDPEKFHQVQLAYEVLSDDERRTQYDETGDTDQQASGGLSAAEQEVVKIFDSLIDQDFEGDMIKQAKKLVNQGRARGHEERGVVRRKLAKYKKQRKRVTTEAEEDLFTMVLDSKIQKCDNTLESIESALKLADQIDTTLDQYKDQKPQEPPKTDFSSGTLDYAKLAEMMRHTHKFHGYDGI